MAVIDLYRHDITLFKAAGGSDSRQVPAGSATIDLYWKGARVAGPASGTVGVVVPVYDPGTISVNDVVKKNGVGTSGTVSAVSAGTVTVTWGASVSVDDGDRIVITTRALGDARPTAYEDVAGTSSLGSQVTTGATTGGVSFYTRPRDIDMVATVGGQTAVLADQAGQGGFKPDPYDFGLVGNGIADDQPALARLINYVSLKGKCEIELPAGLTIQLGSTLTINQPVVIRGAGRNSTFINATAALTPMISVTANNVVLANMTIGRSGAGAAGSIQLQTTGQNGLYQNLGFQYGAIGIRDNGIDNTYFDIIFELSGWENFYKADQALGFHCYSMRGTSSTAISAANAAYLLDGAREGRMYNCVHEFNGVVDGRSLLVTQSGANVPRSLIFDGCKFVAANSTTPTQPVVSLEDGAGLRFIGCDLSYGLSGYHIDGASDVQIIGGSVVACEQNSVDIDVGNHIHIVELLSSDNNGAGNADHRADHINVAAGVDNVSVNGLTVGRIVIGGGNTARYGVGVEAGVSDDLQIMGVRGVAGDLTGDFVNNASTSQLVDVGHNLDRTGATGIHTAVPGGYDAAGQAGTKLLSGAETTTDVGNVSSVFLAQSGNTVWTDLTNGREGQEVTVVNLSAAFTAQFADGAVFQLSATPFTLTQHDSITFIRAGTVWVEKSRTVVI